MPTSAGMCLGATVCHSRARPQAPDTCRAPPLPPQLAGVGHLAARGRSARQAVGAQGTAQAQAGLGAERAAAGAKARRIRGYAGPETRGRARRGAARHAQDQRRQCQRAWRPVSNPPSSFSDFIMFGFSVSTPARRGEHGPGGKRGWRSRRMSSSPRRGHARSCGPGRQLPSAMLFSSSSNASGLLQPPPGLGLLGQELGEACPKLPAPHDSLRTKVRMHGADHARCMCGASLPASTATYPLHARSSHVQMAGSH